MATAVTKRLERDTPQRFVALLNWAELKKQPKQRFENGSQRPTLGKSASRHLDEKP
jgi:hypothetical protein